MEQWGILACQLVTHGVPAEGDGTLGSPGVPAGGHGIENQLVPGGSPSATEIDARVGGGVLQASVRQHVASTEHGNMEGSTNEPYSKGPYELGHKRP